MEEQNPLVYLVEVAVPDLEAPASCPLEEAGFAMVGLVEEALESNHDQVEEDLKDLVEALLLGVLVEVVQEDLVAYIQAQAVRP